MPTLGLICSPIGIKKLLVSDTLCYFEISMSALSGRMEGSAER